MNSPGKVYCVCDEYAEMQRWLDARPAKKQYLQGVLERMKFNSYLWNYDRLSEEPTWMQAALIWRSSSLGPKPTFAH